VAALETGARVELKREARLLGTRGSERVRAREGGDGLRDLIAFEKEKEGGGCKIAREGFGLVRVSAGLDLGGLRAGRWLQAGPRGDAGWA
jgi:hypothetical protein